MAKMTIFAKFQHFAYIEERVVEKFLPLGESDFAVRRIRVILPFFDI